MRELVFARLVEKTLLAASAQCFHLVFAWPVGFDLRFEPGQFLSFVAEDPTGKSYTRAYSLASAPRGDQFDLCVNRVEGGFFSHHLCDMQVGETIGCHGPHGLFTLQQSLSEMLWVAAGTGIAPMRGFAQQLFAADTPSGKKLPRVALVYQATNDEELFYDREFRSLAAVQPGFAYLPVRHQADVEEAIAEFTQRASVASEAAVVIEARAYVCGLAELVKPVRACLLSLGWSKQQISFERYD